MNKLYDTEFLSHVLLIRRQIVIVNEYKWILYFNFDFDYVNAAFLSRDVILVKCRWEVSFVELELEVVPHMLPK